jgi:hypothetical protein
VINSSTAKKLEQAYLELGGVVNLAMVAGDVGDKSIGEKLQPPLKNLVRQMYW